MTSEDIHVNFPPLKIFRLNGASAEAAHSIYSRRMRPLDTQQLTLDDIHSISTNLGLRPVTIVDFYADGLPRAYHMTPSLEYLKINDNPPVFYLLAPTGYDGLTVVPVDAILLTNEEANRLSRLLPLIYAHKTGVKLPDNYKVENAFHAQFSAPYMPDYVFYARKIKPETLIKLDYFIDNFCDHFLGTQEKIDLREQRCLSIQAIKKGSSRKPSNGFTPISRKLLRWIMQDTTDLSFQITPPPMPDEIAREFEGFSLPARITTHNAFEQS